jgi:hypothetical protein
MSFLWGTLVFPCLFFVLAVLVFVHQGTWLEFSLNVFDLHHITYTAAAVVLGLVFLSGAISNKEKKLEKKV